MVDTPNNNQKMVDALLRLAAETDQVEMVLLDAKRGLDDPASLTLLEIQRVCFALVAAYAVPRQV